MADQDDAEQFPHRKGRQDRGDLHRLRPSGLIAERLSEKATGLTGSKTVDVKSNGGREQAGAKHAEELDEPGLFGNTAVFRLARHAGAVRSAPGRPLRRQQRNGQRAEEPTGCSASPGRGNRASLCSLG